MQIPYTIRQSKRAKHLSLSVKCDASVVLTVPQRFSLALADKFFQEKLDWVKDKLALFELKNQQTTNLVGSRTDYLRHRRAAGRLIRQRIIELNQFYKFSYKQLSIKNQSTAWGSCSAQKNLNFNYRLLFLPIELCDYVIVHELCHLKQLNHGPRFWQLVEQTMPDHKLKRKKLRDDYRIK